MFTELDLKTFEMIQEIYDESYSTYNAWISLYNKKTLLTPNEVKSTFSEMMIEDLSVGRAVRNLNKGFINALMDYVYLVYGIKVDDFRSNFYNIIFESTYTHFDYVSILKVFISTLDKYALQSEKVLNTQAIIDIKNDLSDLMHNDSKGNFNVVHRDRQIIFNFRVMGTKDGEPLLKLDKLYPLLRAIVCFNNTAPVLKSDIIGQYGDLVAEKIGLEIPLNPSYTIMWFKINKSGSVLVNFYTKDYAEQFFNMWCQRRTYEISKIYCKRNTDIKIKQCTAFLPRADIQVYDIVKKEDGTRDIITMPYWEYYYSSEDYMPVVDLENGNKIVDLPIRTSNKYDECDDEYGEEYEDDYDEDDYDEE